MLSVIDAKCCDFIENVSMVVLAYQKAFRVRISSRFVIYVWAGY